VAALPTLAQVTAVARGKALTGAVEIEAAQLETAAHQPDTVECRPVALVGGREGIFATQIRRDTEGDRLVSTEGWGRHVIEPRQRVSTRGLPPLTQPLREGRLQPVGVGPASHDVHGHRPKIGEGPPADVTEGIVHAGHRIVGQVDVVQRGPLRRPLVSTTYEDVIRLYVPRVVPLMLHADRR